MKSVSLNTSMDQIFDDQKLHDEVTALISSYISNSRDTDRISCSELLLDLFGSDAYFSCDQINAMKDTFFSLMAFMADPQINSLFHKQFDRANSNNLGVHLSRVLRMLTVANNRYALAEVALAELNYFGVSTQILTNWKEQYGMVKTQPIAA